MPTYNHRGLQSQAPMSFHQQMQVFMSAKSNYTQQSGELSYLLLSLPDCLCHLPVHASIFVCLSWMQSAFVTFFGSTLSP